MSAVPLVQKDIPTQWSGVWSIGHWTCDSTSSLRRIEAPAYHSASTPGALAVPLIEATIALPPEGTWSIRIQRDSGLFVPGASWERAPAWASDPIRSVPAPATTPAAWTETRTSEARLLRLSIPWTEFVGTGMNLSRRISVVIEMSGTGSASLPPALKNLVSNPVGGAHYARRAATSSLVAARGLARKALALPEGDQSLVYTVRNPAVGDPSNDRVTSITGEQIRSVLGSLAGVDFDRVAVGSGAMGPVGLFADSAIPAPGLSLIPIRRIDKDGDGVFDAEDRIEFYAQGPSFWTRDADDSALGENMRSLSIHPWDMSRRYLIRLDATQGSPELAVGKEPGAPVSVAFTLRPAWAGKHTGVRVPELGQAGTPDYESGIMWFWHWVDSARLDSSELRHGASDALPGLEGTTGVGVVRFGGVGSVRSQHLPSTGDVLRTYAGPSTFGATSGVKIAWNLTGLKSSGNRYTWSAAGAGWDFESYTVHYPYAPSKAALVPFPAPRVGAFSLPVKDASLTDSVVVVENGVGVRILPLAGARLRDSATVPGTWYVPATAVAAPSSALARWRAPTASQVLAPSQMSGTLSAQLVIVAPDSFVDLAVEHASFRSDSRRVRPLTTRVVRTDDLWLLWGHGSQDPLAIRDMLRHARAQWGTTHVLILGGGHFDPRGVTGAVPGPIPTWEDYDVGTDAVLAFLDPGEMDTRVISNPGNRIADVAVGRIPARSRAEASAVLAKIRLWEDPTVASPGPWRNTFLATADDMIVRKDGGSPDPINGTSGHTEASERIMGAIASARSWAQFRKVYEVEYPMNAVLEKPDAQRALLDQLNRGVAAMQYMGHGGSDILSDERLLDTRSALLGLSNSQAPFIFYAGSCTVGRHDMTSSRGFSEALVVAANKGAVASIAGTRPSYPDNNESLSKAFWEFVLRHASDGSPRTIGEAFQLANNSFAASAQDGQNRYSNSSVYNLLGDPAMVPFPAGSPLSMDNGPDTLSALDTYDLLGSAESNVQVSLVGPPTAKTATYTSGESTYIQRYVSPGRTLVSVRANASGGKYNAHIITPARIPFGDTASIVAYGWNPATLRDSAVVDRQVILSGVGSNTSSDKEGPRIRVLPCDSSWSAGQPFGKAVEVPVPFCLNIFFDDSSGISSSDGPDEGVILSVPGTLDPWHPTEIEEGANYTQAWTRLSLDAATFSAGKTYPLQIFARDLMGNASLASLEIHTRKAGEVDLYEVFNRPNPAKGASTTFYFKLLSDADSNGVVPSTVQASIRIHTISGKLVRILRTDLSEVGTPRPRAIWDLKDSFRNEVANGLYPYTVILRVKSEEGGNWRQIEKRGIVAVSR